MKRSVRLLMLMATLSALAWSGCATGRAIRLSGSLAPAGPTLPADNSLPRVAVFDFDHTAGEEGAIGRDYDNVRSILWVGNAGVAVADRVAAALVARRVPVVRVGAGESAPRGVTATVRGRVDEFRVNAKRIHSVKVESVGRVALTLFAEGDGIPKDWNASVSADFWSTDPFFVTPDGVRDALVGAANGAAEEAANRLSLFGGVFSPSYIGSPASVGSSPRP